MHHLSRNTRQNYAFSGRKSASSNILSMEDVKAQRQLDQIFRSELEGRQSFAATTPTAQEPGRYIQFKT
jgi:hypothetical protein